MLFTPAEAARDYATRHEKNPELAHRFIEGGGFTGGVELLRSLFAGSEKAPEKLGFEVAALFEYGYASHGVEDGLAGWRHAGPWLQAMIPALGDDLKNTARQALRRAACNQDNTPLSLDSKTGALVLDFMLDVCLYAQDEKPAAPVPVASPEALAQATEFFTNILGELHTHNAKIAHSSAVFTASKPHTPIKNVFLSGMVFNPVVGGMSGGGQLRVAPLFGDFSTALLEVEGVRLDMGRALADEGLRSRLRAIGVFTLDRVAVVTPVQAELSNKLLPRVKFPAGADSIELNIVPSNGLLVQMLALADRVRELNTQAEAQAKALDEKVWTRWVSYVPTVGSNPNNVGTVYLAYAGSRGLPRFAATNQTRVRQDGRQVRRFYTVENHFSTRLTQVANTHQEGPLARHQLSGKWLPHRARRAIGEGFGRKAAFDVARLLRRIQAPYAALSAAEREACLATASTPLQRFVLRTHTENDLEALAAQCTRALGTAREDVIAEFTSAILKNLEPCA